MHAEQQTKYVSVTPPAAIVDNDSYTCASIDTQGFSYVTIICYLGATDIAMGALKVQESDTDGSYADVTGLVYGTSADIAGATSGRPPADDDNKIFAFEIDMRGRKRYLKLVATAGNGSLGTYFTALAVLSRAADMPVSKTERGCGNILRV